MPARWLRVGADLCYHTSTEQERRGSDHTSHQLCRQVRMIFQIVSFYVFFNGNISINVPSISLIYIIGILNKNWFYIERLFSFCPYLKAIDTAFLLNYLLNLYLNWQPKI